MVEILGNTLSALVIDQIDNMGSLVLFNWARTNYNMVTSSPDFMIAKSSRANENCQIVIYFIMLAIVVIQYYNLYVDFEYFFEQIMSYDSTASNMEYMWIITFLVNVAGILFISMLVFGIYYCATKYQKNKINPKS